MKRFVRRIYENVALVATRQVRTIVLFWARQCRKSTTLGNIAFDEMSKEAGRNVIAASASLLVGSELVTKAVSALEQAELVTREAAAVHNAFEAGVAENGKVQMRVANAKTGKEYAHLTGENFADLYSTGRLVLKLYHDRTAFSRLLVIAPNPVTARGWTGTVIRDEAGFTPANMEVELQGAVGPIIDADPTFKMIYASNLSRDDRHPFFEMTLPPPDMTFEPSARGHFYRGGNDILVHRVSLADAYAAGHVLYDQNSGAPLTLEEFRKRPGNLLHLPYNYHLNHKAGGTAAVDLFALMTAQRAGARNCAFVFVESDEDWLAALRLMRVLLGPGAVGLGFDVATTTGETSNPSSLTVTERGAVELSQRLVAVWKTKDAKVARQRLADAVQAVNERPAGGKARRLCIDATNEKYFADETATELGGMVPVELVVSSESIQPPGYPKATNYKTLLGDLYSAAINENRYAFASDPYIKKDHRLVVKDGGIYKCTPEPDGMHGDTFDSGKLANWALDSTQGALTSVAGIRMGFNARGGLGRPIFQPRRLG